MQLGTGTGIGILKPLTALTALSAGPLRVFGAVQPAKASTKSLNGYQSMPNSSLTQHVSSISSDVIMRMEPRATTKNNHAASPTTLSTSTTQAVETSIVDDASNNDEENNNNGGGGGTVGGGGSSVSSGKSGCFSLESSFLDILQENSTVTIPMSSLQEGDQVVTGHEDGMPILQTFTGDYFHRNQNQHFDFIKVNTADSGQLTVTRNHYVMALIDGKEQPVMAGSLRLGDKLLKDGKPVEIDQIEATHEKGAASPMLSHDALKVNGFSVSTYSGLRLAGIDILGYAINSHVIDAAVGLTHTLKGADTLKPSEENNGQVETLGQNILDTFGL